MSIERYLSLLGYRRSELIGRPAYELRANGALVSAREWRALIAQRQFTGTADVLASGGRRLRVEFAGHPEIVTGKRLFCSSLCGRGGTGAHSRAQLVAIALAEGVLSR